MHNFSNKSNVTSTDFRRLLDYPVATGRGGVTGLREIKANSASKQKCSFGFAELGKNLILKLIKLNPSSEGLGIL